MAALAVAVAAAVAVLAGGIGVAEPHLRVAAANAATPPDPATTHAGAGTRPLGANQLRRQLASGRGRVSKLNGAVTAAARRVDQLDAGIATATGEVAGLQRRFDAERADLLDVRDRFQAAQARLAQLQANEQAMDRELAMQLVGSYEQEQPDIVTTVVEATGFDNLLERLEYVSRISRQDGRVVSSVKAARAAVVAQASRLGTLSARRQQMAEQLLTQRNQLAEARVGLVSRRLAAARARASAADALAGARSQVNALAAQLANLEATQRERQPSPSGAMPANRRFVFPMPRGDVSPPATWTEDNGVDIAAPAGTPELAVCSGTVVLHGIGGFGPSTPVLHCDQPLSGYDFVYYGHAGAGDWVSIGTHLAQGQTVSEVGYGIVGISTGPHLEIGFADASGSPIGSSSAPAMMSLLRAAY